MSGLEDNTNTQLTKEENQNPEVKNTDGKPS